MALPNARARRGHDASDSERTDGDGLLSGGPPSTVLRPVGHPALIAHVNDCDDCLYWLLALSCNMVLSKKRGTP